MQTSSDGTGGNNRDRHENGFCFLSFHQNVGVPNNVFDSAMSLVDYCFN